MNVQIYTEAIRCNSEQELYEYARKNLSRPFTDLEILALMKVIISNRNQRMNQRMVEAGMPEVRSDDECLASSLVLEHIEFGTPDIQEVREGLDEIFGCDGWPCWIRRLVENAGSA